MGHSTYAGHFLLEAEKRRLHVPADMKASLAAVSESRSPTVGSERLRRTGAQRWESKRSHARRPIGCTRWRSPEQPEIGAMNRLRETPRSGLAERWLLAAAYQLAGQPDAARRWCDSDTLGFAASRRRRLHVRFRAARPRRGPAGDGHTGQRWRGGETWCAPSPLQLADGGWYSTQAVAFALLAMAQLAGSRRSKSGFQLRLQRRAQAASRRSTGESAIANVHLPAPATAPTPLTFATPRTGSCTRP